MWDLGEIEIHLEAVDGPTTLARIVTPAGVVELIGELVIRGRTLHAEQAHMDGPGAGALQRAGLNRIFDKLLVEADVDEIIVQGGIRTTGRNPGRAPRPFRYPRKPALDDEARGHAATRVGRP